MNSIDHKSSEHATCLSCHASNVALQGQWLDNCSFDQQLLSSQNQQEALAHYHQVFMRHYPALLASMHLDSLCTACQSLTLYQYLSEIIASESSLSKKLEIARLFYNPKVLLYPIDYTVESGLYVFSQWFLLKRGYCCKNRCRHCPYTDWTAHHD